MVAVWLMMIVACTADREGDDPGECSDGADNDVDGEFDCDDAGCAGSPDCDGSGPGSDPDTGGGPDDPPNPDDPDDPPPTDDEMAAYCEGTDVAPITSASMSFELTFDSGGIALLPNCTATYEGLTNDTPAVVEGRCVTLRGTWVVAQTDCDPSLTGLVWTVSSELAHTFRFDESGTALEAWISHAEPREGVPSDDFEEQFWIDELVSDDLTSGGSATYFDERLTPDQLTTIRESFAAEIAR